MKTFALATLALGSASATLCPKTTCAFVALPALGPEFKVIRITHNNDEVCAKPHCAMVAGAGCECHTAGTHPNGANGLADHASGQVAANPTAPDQALVQAKAEAKVAGIATAAHPFITKAALAAKVAAYVRPGYNAITADPSRGIVASDGILHADGIIRPPVSCDAECEAQRRVKWCTQVTKGAIHWMEKAATGNWGPYMDKNGKPTKHPLARKYINTQDACAAECERVHGCAGWAYRFANKNHIHYQKCFLLNTAHVGYAPPGTTLTGQDDFNSGHCNVPCKMIRCAQGFRLVGTDTHGCGGTCESLPWVIKVSKSNDGNARNLARCTGECDGDKQCAPGLKCFERSNGEAIPGCDVSTAPGGDWDYCYDPSTNVDYY